MESAIAYAPGQPGLRLDLIIRTSKRKKEARSPQQQRDIAEACAMAHGHEIVHVHDSGTDESGKTMNRRSLNEAMARRRAGLTDGIIVALADRLGRAPIEEAMTTVRQWVTEGNLVLADMGGMPIDLSNGVNETNVVMQLQFARQYWLTTANRFQRSQRDAIAAGKWIGIAPIGFVKVAEGKRKGCLDRDPDTWTIVRDCYRLVAAEGIDAGVRFMARMIPWREWNSTELRRVLKCKAYKGETHHGTHVPNLNEPRDPIVTATEWERAQTEPQPRRGNGEYPLSGFMHCPCGGELKGGLQTVKARGYSYRRYRCATCARCSVRAEPLEDYVLAVLRHALGEAGFRAGFGVEGLETAENALTEARERRSGLTDSVSPAHPDFAAWLAKEDANVAAAQAEYQRLAMLASQSERLPYAHELDDPDALALALNIVTSRGRFVVAFSGKGARVAVEDRVSFVGDDPSGALAARVTE